MASISIQGSIQFQSNSTKEQSCHIVAYTLVNAEGRILTSNLGRWLRVVAIRPKNTSDIVLPGNTNPFVYNINETFNLIDCNFVGCNIFLRVYVIPCCRINQDVTGSILNDPKNPLYDVVDLTTNGAFNPPITSLGNDGYAYKDILLHNPAMYRCKKFKAIASIPGIGFYNVLTSPSSKLKCLMNASLTSGPINVPSALASPPYNSMVLPNIEICTNFDVFTINNFEEITDKNGICCNRCDARNVNTVVNDGNRYVAVYQDCNTGDIVLDEVVASGSNVTVNKNYCVVTNSFFAYIYNGSTFIPVSSTTTGECRNCPNLFVS